jgi:hypothetical protein
LGPFGSNILVGYRTYWFDRIGASYKKHISGNIYVHVFPKSISNEIKYVQIASIIRFDWIALSVLMKQATYVNSKMGIYPNIYSH